MAEDNRETVGDGIFDFLDNYFRCCVDQMVVKIMMINLWEVVWNQGLETEIRRFCIFASPVIKGVCPASPTVVPPPCWRPLMARPGYAWSAHNPSAPSNPNYQWDCAIPLRWSGVGKIKLKTSDVVTEEEHEESQGWELMLQFAMASVFWPSFRFPRNYPFWGMPGFCAFPQSPGLK